MGCLPLAVIVVLAILITRKVYDSDSGCDADAKADALSLIMVVCLFIVCNAAALSLTFLELFLGKFNR